MYKKIIGVSTLLAGTALVLAPLATATGKDKNDGSAPQKVFVCKYVRTPGGGETLQTGQNPIAVSINAIPSGSVSIGSSFADRQGRSLVIAFAKRGDNGRGLECPGKVIVTTIPSTTTIPPTTVVPTTLPPTTIPPTTVVPTTVVPTTVVPTTVVPTTVVSTTVPPVTVTAVITPLSSTTTTAAVPPVKKTPASVIGKRVPKPKSPVTQVRTPPAGGVEGGDGSSVQALAFTGVDLTAVLIGIGLMLLGLALLLGKRLTILRR